MKGSHSDDTEVSALDHILCVETLVSVNDILVITPYNAQVFELQQLLPGARIGTVDKFQGQEAPLQSIHWRLQATQMRRGEFLYSLNRLNVSLSCAGHARG
jgi:uncharacterized protein